MVVKSATKKKLMDLGIEEGWANLLANDRKWADIKELSTVTIALIISGETELDTELTNLFAAGPTNYFDDGWDTMLIAKEIKEKIHGINDIHNTGHAPEFVKVDQLPFETIFTSDDFNHGFGEVGDAVLVGALHPHMKNFLDKWHSEGPDGEHFVDPNWEHCNDYSCGLCPHHKVHHGLSTPKEAFGDVDPLVLSSPLWDQFMETNVSSLHVESTVFLWQQAIIFHKKKENGINEALHAQLFHPKDFNSKWIPHEDTETDYMCHTTSVTPAHLEAYTKGTFGTIGIGSKHVYFVNNNAEDYSGFHPTLNKNNPKYPKNKKLISSPGVENYDEWPQTAKQALYKQWKKMQQAKTKMSAEEYDSNLNTLQKEMVTKMNEETSNKKSKTVKYPVNSKKRAAKILRAIYRFDDSWDNPRDRENMENTFVNSLRCSPTLLRGLVATLLENLLKKEAHKLFKTQMFHLNDSVYAEDNNFHENLKEIKTQIDNYYNLAKPKTELEEFTIIERLTDLVGTIVGDCLDNALIHSVDMGQTHRNLLGPISRDSEPKQQLKDLLADTNSIMDNIFVKGLLAYDSNDGNFDPDSQKAKGVRAIAMTQQYRLFYSARVLHLSLDTAAVSSARDLMLSIYRTWGTGRNSRRIWSKSGFFIRTCPATPRPGALPNVLAKNEKDFVEGVRMLSQCMLNPAHPDYDPKGSLIVQRFKKPICSGVVGKGATSFIIGPNHDGVTAGGGSNIVFNLNAQGQRYLSGDIRRINLEDGMDNHEIEFVYENPKTSTLLTWFKQTADARHNGKNARIKPGITQMRGLHTAKNDIMPPPSVNGVVLHIAGNVPAGVVKQKVVMDVGKGSLEECLELEQLANSGQLPEGLVVYAPGGTQNAHVGGVSVDFGFPVIYGIKPMKNGTIWTEIQGWVTDQPGAEPEPYNPEPFMDFYKIGLRDGDRFWTYNLAPLSQFFHNFISGPKNDPRLEAYLAGIFTTWITKAALAVSMAELRHGLGGRCDMTPPRSFSHIMYQKAISGETGIGSLFRRSEYYERLNYNEIGYDDLHEIAKFYADSYHGDICEWNSSSYGGKKYYLATEPTVHVTRLIKKLMNGQDVPLSKILAQVNKLENAVHNTGFFFNKFLGDKDAFDIGTTGHMGFASACEHWIITAPFYALFYTNYVNEPDRVAKGHDKLVQHLHNRLEKNTTRCDFKTFSSSDIYSMSEPTNTTLVDLWDAWGVGESDRNLFIRPLSDGSTLHVEGVCGLSACERTVCQNYHIMKVMGLSDENSKVISTGLEKYLSEWSIQFTPDHIPTASTIEAHINGMGTRSPEQTMFDEKDREIVSTEMEVESWIHGLKIFKISGTSHLWIDKMLGRWLKKINDKCTEWDANGTHISSTIDAWNNPEKYFPLVYEIADKLDNMSIIWGDDSKFILHSHLFNIRGLRSSGKTEWETNGDANTFKEILSRMLGHHLVGRGNTHQLLQQLHTETGNVLGVTEWEKII